MGLQTATGADRVDSAFDDAQVVTPSDTLTPAHRLSGVRALWSDTGGNVTLITEAAASKAANVGPPVTSGSAVTFIAPAGGVIHVRAAYVLATGTDDQGLKALL